MFPVMFIVSAVLFVFGYKFYGDFMAKVYDLDNKNPTPAEQLNDGVDYCPAHPAVVLVPLESLSREWQTEPLSVGRYFDI